MDAVAFTSPILSHGVRKYSFSSTNITNRRALRQKTRVVYACAPGTNDSTVFNVAKSSVAPAVTSSPAKEKKPFNWLDRWYPAMFEVDIKDNKPYPFLIFDTPLVLFRTSDGLYGVFDNECPHRGAPLSEGRVVEGEDGTTLECAYHGWAFSCSGKCVCIPQIPLTQNIPSALDVRSYPTMVEFGLVFVWLGDPASATRDKLPIPEPVRLHRENNPDGFLKITSTLTSYLPYDMQTFLENVLDPAHAPWSHHRASYLLKRDFVSHSDSVAMKSHDPVSGDIDFARIFGENFFRTKEPVSVDAAFRAPCLLSYWSEGIMSPKGNVYANNFYCVPAGPNRCRVCAFDSFATPKLGFKIRTYFALFALVLFPKWLQHMMIHRVFDGDTPLLVGQERILRTKYQGDWRKMYRAAPAGCDVPLRAYRTWLDKVMPYAPWRDPAALTRPPPEMTRREMLDRYWTHTVNCNACSGAYRQFKTMRNFGVLMALMSVVAGVYSTVFKMYVKVLFVTLVGLLCSALACWAEGLRRGMHYTDNARKLYEMD